MWLKWFPWKFLISYAAKRHGFLDPVVLWSYFQRFSQPSEVAGPIELIRDNIVFHSRGLINSRAIPQNSDWVWPYWIQRQFNPSDKSFVPSAFSLTYINLTHRNWTAAGLPGLGQLPIVDPAGMVTPHWDGWSLDFWLVDKQGNVLSSSKTDGKTMQRLCFFGNLAVVTKSEFDSGKIISAVQVRQRKGEYVCDVKLRVRSSERLAVSLRPYNPEGVSFVHTVKLDDSSRRWEVNDKTSVLFDRRVDNNYMQRYADGDVSTRLAGKSGETEDSVKCKVGMATAAAVFEPDEDGQLDMNLFIPLKKQTFFGDRSSPKGNKPAGKAISWKDSLKGRCRIVIPDKKKQRLYETALRSVALHVAGEDVYPGPFTYKRFWFRDASFILDSLLCANLSHLAAPVLNSYPSRQKTGGYFRSQDGEWDSNGQAIWIIHRNWKMTGRPLSADIFESVCKAADWICRKCTNPDKDSMHAGLLPAGFSAEHFGPNDHYYWDDFWALAGLHCAAEIAESSGMISKAEKYHQQARTLRRAIDSSIEKVCAKLNQRAIPVSPYRRLDAGAVGSVVCGYPLQLVDPEDSQLLATVEFLMNSCRVKDGFFLDISHSGINPYLTLHIAQILLRAGDKRHFELAETLERLASPTGQWPEAVHPITEGGCMGDGQHIWAAAEWVNYMRSCLVYEQKTNNQLILGAGIHPDWTKAGEIISAGPAPTLWGTINLTLHFEENSVSAEFKANWNGKAPEVVLKIPGFEQKTADPNAGEISAERMD
ncbi:hypothetical protein [Sedimentisphaera salicampi]|uniref:Putative glucoamylase hydrolase n=1 Tax=Sedimentisphaera salicampi TaxID=1941349 RepID=A0A1W6LLS0_9BACT|nr:hypothetical protein [Sedimentisphaera salicampi]ARN56711.1 putative glucoamylase hydrolase [Sedimentisphaera salicampi]OXU15151.1 putative glucoamylase hydrolase [Sedimentisphaera salicampi]